MIKRNWIQPAERIVSLIFIVVLESKNDLPKYCHSKTFSSKKFLLIEYFIKIQ